MCIHFQVFKGDGGEVQGHWVRYTERMDRMVEEAFRLNVKWSLQALSRAINGDGKTSPNPLFKVNVVLKKIKVYIVHISMILIFCNYKLKNIILFRLNLSPAFRWWQGILTMCYQQ